MGFWDDEPESAANTSGVKLNGGAPRIVVRKGELARIADEGEAAILASGIPLYQRDKSLFYPMAVEIPVSNGHTTVSASLQRVVAGRMLDMLAQSAHWERWDTKLEKLVPTDPPPSVVQIMLARAGNWGVPTVSGVITTPTLRPDGSVLTATGYDKATRLYHVPDPYLRMPEVSEKPDKWDALEALELLDSVLEEFPFVDVVDRSVALSAIITTVVRGIMRVAPLHAFSANIAGSGKSYIVDCIAAIVSARECPTVSVAPTPQETDSRLVGLLLAGYPIVSLDNVNGELGSELLCQAVERPMVRVRALGASDIYEIESRATWLATGNNIQIRDDMIRRSLLCRMDAEMERPETREFQHRPLDDIMEDRGRYVAAAMTLVRAYMRSGEKHVAPLGSFETWSNTVRSALLWLGRPDPVKSIEAVRDSDPDTADLRSVLASWYSSMGMDPRGAAEVISLSQEMHEEEFRDSIRRVATIRGSLDSRKLSHWLRRNEGKIAAGFRLMRGQYDRTRNIERWSVRKLEG